jgi:hypothetical protein
MIGRGTSTADSRCRPSSSRCRAQEAAVGRWTRAVGTQVMVGGCRQSTDGCPQTGDRGRCPRPGSVDGRRQWKSVVRSRPRPSGINCPWSDARGPTLSIRSPRPVLRLPVPGANSRLTLSGVGRPVRGDGNRQPASEARCPSSDVWSRTSTAGYPMLSIGCLLTVLRHPQPGTHSRAPTAGHPQPADVVRQRQTVTDDGDGRRKQTADIRRPTSDVHGPEIDVDCPTTASQCRLSDGGHRTTTLTARTQTSDAR